MAVLEFEEMAAASIREAFGEGARAASWAAFEVDGRRVCRAWRGTRNVETRARLVGEDGVVTDAVVPLSGLWRVPGLGERIERLGAPDPSYYFWQAAAVQHEDGHTYLAAAVDYRGMAAVPLSRLQSSRGDGRTVGQHATKALSSTSIDGLRGRVREANERLGGGESEQAVIVASALAEAFASPETQGDGGAPLLEWIVLHSDLSLGAVEVLGSSGPRPALGEDRRRSRLFDAYLRGLEHDAFGEGIHSARGTREFRGLLDDEELPDPIRRDAGAGMSEVARWDGLTAPDFSGEVVDSLAFADLLERAGLTEREREAFELRELEDLDFGQVAERMGIAAGTARVTFRNALAKMEAARA